MVDDIGLLPVPTEATEGLYRLVDAACEKRSVAVSSNLHPSGFDEIMPKTLAGATVDRLLHHAHLCATVDRLLHHAHLCATVGDSVRLAQATSGKGVKPLTCPRGDLVATGGENSWPHTGRFHGRPRRVQGP